MSDRRKSPRHAVRHLARYRLADQVDGWHLCEVLDLSNHGARLVLYSGPRVERGASLRVQLSPYEGHQPGDIIDVRVRHVTPHAGRLTIGVELCAAAETPRL